LQLRAAEEQIILRSRAVEMRWSSDKYQQSVKGTCNFYLHFCLSVYVNTTCSAEATSSSRFW